MVTTTHEHRRPHPLQYSPRTATLWIVRVLLSLGTSVGFLYLLQVFLTDPTSDLLLLGLLGCLFIGVFVGRLLRREIDFSTPGALGSYTSADQATAPSHLPRVIVRALDTAVPVMVTLYPVVPWQGTQASLNPVAGLYPAAMGMFAFCELVGIALPAIVTAARSVRDSAAPARIKASNVLYAVISWAGPVFLLTVLRLESGLMLVEAAITVLVSAGWYAFLRGARTHQKDSDSGLLSRFADLLDPGATLSERGRFDVAALFGELTSSETEPRSDRLPPPEDTVIRKQAARMALDVAISGDTERGRSALETIRGLPTDGQAHATHLLERIVDIIKAGFGISLAVLVVSVLGVLTELLSSGGVIFPSLVICIGLAAVGVMTRANLFWFRTETRGCALA